MARIIVEPELLQAISENRLISGAVSSSVEGIKYDFRLGNRFLKSYFTRPVSYDCLSSTERILAVVQPGEVVFVLTEERLCLPKNIFVQLSPKRKLSHAGIHLLGGLTIDPGYNGYLLFGLCNLSSTPFQLSPGKKLVGAVFYELDEKEAIYNSPPEALEDFPDELIAIIKEYDPIVLKSLADEINRLKQTIENDNGWRKEFQAALGDNNHLINEISESLKSEIHVRQLEGKELGKKNEELSTSIKSIENSVAAFTIETKGLLKALKVIAWIIGTIITATVAGLLIIWISKMIA